MCDMSYQGLSRVWSMKLRVRVGILNARFLLVVLTGKERNVEDRDGGGLSIKEKHPFKQSTNTHCPA